jgi:hypothetical protein
MKLEVRAAAEMRWQGFRGSHDPSILARHLYNGYLAVVFLSLVMFVVFLKNYSRINSMWFHISPLYNRYFL